MNKNKNIEVHVGFLSVMKIGSSSFIGGYLLLNTLGRPIEFHCTEAVKPTRAQQILYGSALDSYLYSDLLGKSLIAAAKTKPAIVFVDSPSALELSSVVDASVLLVMIDTSAEPPRSSEELLGENRVVAADRSLAHVPDEIQDRIREWDLSEPFQRIQEAIQETQKAA